MTTNYTPDIQKMFLEFMLSDSSGYARVQNIFNPANFDKSLRSTANFIKTYVDKYKALPTIDTCNASEKQRLKPIIDITDAFTEWFMSEFELFTRRQELERAILKSADLLEKGEYGPVEKLIKDAVQISLTRNLGLDYFEDPIARLQRIKLNNGEMTTGWPDLDKVLYGGWSRGTVNIVAGASGTGKSLFLQNLSLNLISSGKHGVYITLELSEELCSLRIDAMITGIGTNMVFKDLDSTELKVKMYGKKSGKLQIKYMQAQSTSNDLRAFIKELEISTGRKLDFITVDYLDLLMPASVKVNPTDVFTKDKFVTEELRNLATELNIVLLTAAQFNRGGVDEIEFSHADISGGISKIYTADNVFGIYTSRAMKERGKYQLQALKTRASAGVGQKIDLDYNVESMRITGIVDGANPGGMSPNSVMNQLEKKLHDKQTKSTTTKIIDDATGAVSEVTAIKSNVNAQTQSSKLKQMLAGLKQNA